MTLKKLRPTAKPTTITGVEFDHKRSELVLKNEYVERYGDLIKAISKLHECARCKRKRDVNNVTNDLKDRKLPVAAGRPITAEITGKPVCDRCVRYYKLSIGPIFDVREENSLMVCDRATYLTIVETLLNVLG